MNSFLKVNMIDMTCGLKGHEGSKLVALCVDSNCPILNKFVCLECIFESHPQHKIIKLKLIQDRINTNLQNESEMDDKMVGTRLKGAEEKIVMEMEKIKTNILEILNTKVNNLITEMQEKILQMDKMNNKENFDLAILNKMEIKDMPVYELEKFSSYLTKNIIIDEKNVSDSQILPNTNKRKSVVIELDKFETNFTNFIQITKKSISEFLNSKLLFPNSSILFSESLSNEWSERFYGNYGFLYTMTNNKLTVTKSNQDGTITIVRAKEKLNLNENYYIEYEIDAKKLGDIEVGFGKDAVGVSCWLRSFGAYAVTNVGVYENGKIIKKDVKLYDGDVVGLEINLKTTKTCKVVLNTKLVHEFKIDLDEIYPMCAIRKVGNSVTLKEFKILN